MIFGCPTACTCEELRGARCSEKFLNHELQPGLVFRCPTAYQGLRGARCSEKFSQSKLTFTDGQNRMFTDGKNIKMLQIVLY